MVTLFTLGIICLAAVILIPVILFLVGLPFLLLMGLLPWLLRIAGVVLLIVKCRRLEFYVTPAQLPKGTACSCAFVNAGMGVFITLTVFGMVLALMNVM